MSPDRHCFHWLPEEACILRYTLGILLLCQRIGKGYIKRLFTPKVNRQKMRVIVSVITIIMKII